MFLNHKQNGHMIELLTPNELFNPAHDKVVGRYHYGEEAQDPEYFLKSDLKFLSGEDLPRCWVDVHYRDEELVR